MSNTFIPTYTVVEYTVRDINFIAEWFRLLYLKQVTHQQVVKAINSEIQVS